MSKPSLIGKRIDEYQLEEMLGEGGMASVYRARDIRLNRYVAIKVIRTSLRTDSEYSTRFEREAQAIAQLDHPNIITLYRFGEKDGLLYMAMQYVDGADLAAVIESFQKDDDYIEFKEIIRVAEEIGTALDYAHSQGVIHRDIKPHNIMINRDGRAMVTDFGLALMTEIGTHGEVFGSPHYIAPEQAISSAGAVPQSDLYAMGIVLYEMLTGTVPFDASEPLDIAMMHMSDPVPSPREHRPELSVAVEKVLLKALAKEPSERYATGKELAKALSEALQEQSKPARTTITRKVALEREAHPLPPLPAQVMSPTQLHEAPVTIEAGRDNIVTQVPSYDRKRGNWLVYTAVLSGVVVVLLLLLFMMLNNSDDRGLQPIDDPAAVVAENTATPTEAEAIPTIASVNNSPTPLPLATETPLPVSAATTAPIDPPSKPVPTDPLPYVIAIHWQGEDSLFVTNISRDASFPLLPLSLHGDRGRINGSEWDTEFLSNSECVAAWKDSGNPTSANTSCTLVGNRIERSGPDRFWKSDFVVAYDGAEIARCESSPCIVEIPR